MPPWLNLLNSILDTGPSHWKASCSTFIFSPCAITWFAHFLRRYVRVKSFCEDTSELISIQICRVAYEVMQQRVIDGAWRVQPLDDVYYFGGQNAHNQRAVISHKALWPNEFSFDRGDTIGTEGNHWDGFSKGSDKTNGQSGLYPTYKVEEIVNVAKMYSYPEVRAQDEKI